MAEEKLDGLREKKPLYMYKEIPESYAISLMLNDGYQRIWQNPFGSGGRKEYFVKVRTNESPEHAFFVRIVEQQVRLYTNDLTINDTDGPDIVFNSPAGVVAVEVETGARKQSRSDLESRFRVLSEDYPIVLVLVTDKYMKRHYEQYSNTITRTEIREKIKSYFGNFGIRRVHWSPRSEE